MSELSLFEARDPSGVVLGRVSALKGLQYAPENGVVDLTRVATADDLGIFDANAAPYNCRPNVAADQTAAIQAVMDAAGAHIAAGGTAVIRYTPGKYRVARSPVQNGIFNAQVTLPVIPGSGPRAALTIESKNLSHSPFPFTGGPGSVVFESTLTGLSYSGSYGKPFIFGGPDAIHGTGAGLASYLSLRLRGVGFLAPQDPSIGGINAEMLDQLICENCSWGTTDPNLASSSQGVPTHPTGISVLGPREFFEGTMWLGSNSVAGWYAGFGIDEYTNGVGDLLAVECVVNYNFTGSNVAASGYFVTPFIASATSIRGKYDIAHVDPQTGVADIPDGLAVTGFVPLLMRMRIEDGPAGTWAKIRNVVDGRNNLRGTIELSRTSSSTGLVNYALNNTGALGVDFVDILAPSQKRPIISAPFVAPPGTALASIPFAVNRPRSAWSVWGGGFNSDLYGSLVGTNAGYNRAVVDAGAADCHVSLRVNFPSGGGSVGFIFRATDSNNYYHFEIDYLGNYGVTKVVAGSASGVVGSTGIAGGTLNPFAVGLEVPVGVMLTGNSIRITMNDLALVSFTDSFNATATLHGVQTSNTVATVTEFTVR